MAFDKKYLIKSIFFFNFSLIHYKVSENQKKKIVFSQGFWSIYKGRAQNEWKYETACTISQHYAIKLDSYLKKFIFNSN